MSFPKIIHQIWIQGEDNIPSKYHKYVSQIKSMHNITNNSNVNNGKWKYMLWDDIKIISLLRQDKELIDTYYKLEYLHQKVDFARYIILYMFGGIYIDMDAYTVKPLDNLFKKFKDYNLLVSKLNMNDFEKNVIQYHINNGIVVSKKGSIVLKDLIDTIVSNPHCKSYHNKMGCILATTGPYMFTQVMEKHLEKKNKEVIALENDYLEPCVLNICNETKNTYIKHMHEGSWYSDKIKSAGQMYLRNRNMAYFILIVCLILTSLCCFLFMK